MAYEQSAMLSSRSRVLTLESWFNAFDFYPSERVSAAFKDWWCEVPPKVLSHSSGLSTYQ